MGDLTNKFERRRLDVNLTEDELHELLREEELEPLTQEEIEAQNEYLLKQQQNFRLAVNYILSAWEVFSEVEWIILFGSAARPLVMEIPRFSKYQRVRTAVWHECKDLDIAVWINDLRCRSELRKTLSRASNRLFAEENIGVATHQIDVIILEPGTDCFLGHRCHLGICPKGKRECKVPGGDIPFLRKQLDFHLDTGALAPEMTIELFKRGR